MADAVEIPMIDLAAIDRLVEQARKMPVPALPPQPYIEHLPDGSVRIWSPDGTLHSAYSAAAWREATYMPPLEQAKPKQPAPRWKPPIHRRHRRYTHRG